MARSAIGWDCERPRSAGRFGMRSKSRHSSRRSCTERGGNPGRLDPHAPIVVVTGRPYNLYDERLNLRLGQNLAKIGVAALPMDFIDVSAVDLADFPTMYWGLGAQILRTARFIRARPNPSGCT